MLFLWPSSGGLWKTVVPLHCVIFGHEKAADYFSLGGLPTLDSRDNDKIR